mgnify:CR=1 FL=1
MNKIKELLDYQSEISKLQYLINILNWELRTNCPKDATNYLIDTITSLEVKKFKLETNVTYKKLLLDCINCEQFSNLKDEEQRYIKKL